MWLAKTVNLNLFGKFAWLISTAVVSRRFQKVPVEIGFRIRKFHIYNCSNKSVFDFCEIFQLSIFDVFAIFH